MLFIPNYPQISILNFYIYSANAFFLIKLDSFHWLKLQFAPVSFYRIFFITLRTNKAQLLIIITFSQSKRMQESRHLGRNESC